MIKFCSLYSGSSGNCYYINIDGNRILLDAGKSLKKIREARKFDTCEISKHTLSIGNA